MDWVSTATAAGLVTALSAVLALLTGGAAAAYKRRAEAHAELTRIERRRALQVVSDAFTMRLSNTGDLKVSDLKVSDILVDFGTVESPETREVIADLKERLSAIEERFPARSTVDKLESVNDAILATKIEALEKELTRVSDAMLTKWDVATIVFAVLAGLGVLVGLVAGAIKLFA